jgi:hypothetical protein
MQIPTLDILETAGKVANSWRCVAAGWHAAFLVVAIVVSCGVRASERTAALLLTLPVVSVSLINWWDGNPFNALVFMLLAQAMAGLATTFGMRQVALDDKFRNRAAGLALVVFGLSYPHFLVADSWLSYLYAAPFGLIPCPTVAVTTGVSLLLGAFRSRAWAILVSGLALAYGVSGVVVLHVWIDVFLIAGGVLLLGDALPQSARRLADAG